MTSYPISLHKLLSPEVGLVNVNSSGYPRGQRGRYSIVDDNHYQQLPEPELTTFPTLPVVVKLVRSKMEVRSRDGSDNFHNFISSSSPSSSSPSDGEVLMTIFKGVESGKQPSGPRCQQSNQYCLIFEAVDDEILLGEELFRKSGEGGLVATGRRFEIPRHFDGWFEILSQDGRSSQQIVEVSSLVKKNIKCFLTTKPTTALVKNNRNHTSDNDAGAATTPTTSGHVPITLGVGHVLKAIRLTKLRDGLQYLWCHLKGSGDPESVKREYDEKEEGVLLPLNGQGRFLPISRDPNLTDAHDATFLLTRLRMPVVVKAYWPANKGNMPPLSLDNHAKKGESSKVQNVYKKLLANVKNISKEPMASTILRIHGHHKQRIAYVAPLLPSHLTGSSVVVPNNDGSDVATDGDIKVLPLRLPLCKFFDAHSTDLTIKPGVLEALKIKFRLVQSTFEKEVKIYDSVPYKLVGEKLVINKQPITLLRGTATTISNNDSQEIPLRVHQQQKEGVAKRHSFPLEMMMERDGERVRGGDDEDSESTLMNEIENIYMRVRYWDRSVRYPMPQKVVHQHEQKRRQSQQEQQGMLPVQLQQLNQQRPQQNSQQPAKPQHPLQQVLKEPQQNNRTQVQHQQSPQQLKPKLSQPTQQPSQQVTQQPSQQVTQQPEQVIDSRGNEISDMERQTKVQPEIPPPLPPRHLPRSPSADPLPRGGPKPGRKASLDVVTASTATTAIATKSSPAAPTAITAANNPAATPTTTSIAPLTGSNKDKKGVIKSVFKNLIRKQKGSMDVTRPAGSEFTYFNMQDVK